MNRNDLEDLLEFDSLSAGLGAMGMFLLSGSVWLAAEKILEADPLMMTPILWMCVGSIVFGLVFLYVGQRMHAKKRSRIERIFEETEVYAGSQTLTSQGSGTRRVK